MGGGWVFQRTGSSVGTEVACKGLLWQLTDTKTLHLATGVARGDTEINKRASACADETSPTSNNSKALTRVNA